MRWRTSLLIIFFISSVQAAYVVTQSGRQINGSKISAKENGAVTLTTTSGQIMTFRKGQYREAVADRPEELAQAQRLLESDKQEQAIALLKKVQTEYRFLAWDEMATRQIADYFFDTGQYAEAALEFQSLAHLEDPEIQARHREALMKSGNLELVLPALEKDIASGTREAAARTQAGCSS